LGAWVIYSRLESLTPWVLAGTFGALAYSSAPLGLKYRGLGDLLVLAMVGPLLTWGFSAAAFGILIPGSTEIGLAFGFAACALLHANNLQDIDLDQSRGARTLAGQLGFRKSKTLLSLYHGLAIAPIVVGVLQERIPWTFALASAGVALPFFRTSLAVWKAHSPLSPGIAKIRIQAAQDHLLWGVLMLVALLVSRFLA
jgi:1,4-dihydroxy-2-naphthoate octaprenyltransferase